MKPDRIIPNPSNPQAFNRYSYVLNQPINFNDPTGQAYCDFVNNQNKDDCKAGQWRISSSPNGLDLTGYSDKEKDALQNLYHNGGSEAREAVNYIINHQVHLKFDQQMPPGTGAYWESDGKTLDFGKTNNNAFLLSLIVHETIHLGQGPLGAITVSGELEAWQVQMRVYYILTRGKYPYARVDVQKLLSYSTLDAWTPLKNIEIRILLEKMSPGYHAYCLFPMWPAEFINAVQHDGAITDCLP